MFKLVSKYKPSGDQPKAIKELVEGVKMARNTKFYWVQRELEKHSRLLM